jgi:dimeric dUTPase (all-alpha-NTP-PPase superfamily)
LNLNELFEIQAKLDAHIEKEHPRQPGEDRLAKKILALQVELGELANEWRGFKYWSNNQEPNIRYCHACNGQGYFDTGLIEDGMPYTEGCGYCEETGIEENPLLEEYVDCLHFTLSIGLDLSERTPYIIGDYIAPDVTRQFKFVFEDISKLDRAINNEYEEDVIFDIYDEMVRGLLGLGKMLGFTWEQIEQAYYEKNKINHQRQDSGVY